MKSRLTVSILVLLAVFSASASALTWETYLEDISVPSGTVDISLTYYFNTTGTSGNYTNITLPCDVWELTNVSTTFNITASANQTFNLTVNGNAINASTALNWTDGNTSLTTLSNWSTNETEQYLNFTFDSNITSNIVKITVVASDAAFSSTWLSSYIAIAETVLTAPKITDQQAYSYFSVKDRAVINNSLGYTITDITLVVAYPSHNLSHPSTHINVTTLATGALSYNNISYQKYGPYVTGSIKEDIDDDDHEVTIRVSSHEVLTRLVDWDFDETDDDYEDYFTTLDFDTLEVKLNGVKIDWDEGTIEMDDMTLVDGTNKYEFFWTESAAAVPSPVPGDWDWLTEDYGLLFPIWIWIIIVVTIACLVIAVIYAKKK